MFSAIKGYSRILNKGTPRNRPGFSSVTARRHKRVMGPSTWFQTRPKENEQDEEPRETRKKPLKGEKEVADKRQFQQVMFIQHTENSDLKKKLQSMEDSMGFQDRVKYVERTGTNLGAQLINKDPWGSGCNCPECNICSHQLQSVT